MDFTQRLQVYEFSLSETDDMIGAYISAHRTDAAQMSIQKLAEQLHLAPNALLRFAKKLGYSGFAEMKLALRQEGARTPILACRKTFAARWRCWLPAACSLPPRRCSGPGGSTFTALAIQSRCVR